MSLTIKASRTRKRTAALGVSITTKQDRHVYGRTPRREQRRSEH